LASLRTTSRSSSVGGFKDFLEVFKRLKYSEPQPKFCPVCKGHNIYPMTTFGILPAVYRCADCGYEGAVALEIEPEEEA
jgi:predicted RNA-binding Zn-ribbon protein involved in translation (DUF1610 family)